MSERFYYDIRNKRSNYLMQRETFMTHGKNEIRKKGEWNKGKWNKGEWNKGEWNKAEWENERENEIRVLTGFPQW